MIRISAWHGASAYKDLYYKYYIDKTASATY